MPICPRCGKKFSGFSFGSSVATECGDCRKIKAATAISTCSPAGSPRTVTSGIATPTAIVTLALIGLNILVYAAMGLSGVSWTAPSTEHAIKWGADFGPFTLSGEWWRILTSTFVHFGIIHIALNMWCLWSLGRSLEIFMGQKAFAMTYLLSGLGASLTSIAWNPWRVSAGASGAIFGIAGAFVSYLYLKKVSIDRGLVKQQLKSLLIFIGYNLLYGAAGNVDNSAHLGGLVSGLILGALVPPLFQKEGSTHAETESAAKPPIEEVARPEASVTRNILQISLGGAIVLLIVGMWIRKSNQAVADYGMAVKSVQAGNFNSGIAEMQQAVTIKPNLVIAQALLGEWWLEQGDPAEAIPVFKHALAQVPNAYDIKHNLALAYLGSGRSRDAILEITAALTSEKEDPWRAECILALAQEQAGDFSHARQNLQLIVKSKPDLQEAREALERIGSTSTTASAIPYSKLASKSNSWPLYP